MHINLTVNCHDGDEFELTGSVNDFSELPSTLDALMAKDDLNPDRWSSLMVVIVADKPAA